MSTVFVKGFGNVGFPDDMSETDIQAVLQKQYSKPTVDTKARENLPSTLQFGPFDTGINISPKTSAVLAGMGYGMTDIYRGLTQIKRNALGQPTDDLKEDARLMDVLRNDPEVGNWALGGEMAGYIADPVGLAVPIGKGKSIAQMAKIGAATGAGFGALGYVDEGQSRLGNTALGAAGGAVALPAIGGATNLIRKVRGKPLIPLRQQRSSQFLEDAGIVPTPKEAAPPKQLPSSQYNVTPEGRAGRPKDFDDMGLTEVAAAKSTPPPKPDVPKRPSQGSPVDIEGAIKPEGVVTPSGIDARLQEALDTQPIFRTAEQRVILNEHGIKLHSNPFFDPDAWRGIKNLYQRYAGIPLTEFWKRNPGASFAGLGGAGAGYASADEDAPMTEKIGRAALGALIGFGGVKGVGKLSLGGDNLSEKFSKGFINNYGLPSDYVKIKQNRAIYKNSLAHQFSDIAKEMRTLTPDQRRLMYRMLEGEEPVTADLKALSDKARKQITETGQKMVDLGMLSEETFKKNAATYMHRSYTSKLAPEGVLDKVGRKIKMIGDELKPRGVFKTVSTNEASKYQKLGWELFGKARGGKQKIRWQLTKEQRQMMGEIEDAAFAIAETGRLMSNDIATFKFFDDIAKDSKLASAEPRGDWVQIAEGKIEKTKINKYGNLEGMYVPLGVYDNLKSMQRAKSIKNMPGIRQYRALNSWWKVSKTALNPVVHANNIMANFMLYDFADADYKHLGRAARELRNAGRKAKGVVDNAAQTAAGDDSPFYDLALEHGVFEADFATNELKAMNREWLEAYENVGNIAGDPLSASVNLAKKIWSKTGGNLINAYQKEDHWVRLGVFIDRMEKGMSPADAAIDARRWFIDYDIDAPVINAMRETATPFIAYTYRVIPLLAETATLRPWKFAKWAAIGYGVNAVGEAYSGGDTKRERELMPERQKGKWFGAPFMPPQAIKMPTGLLSKKVRDKLGIGDTSQYQDVTRWIPGGDVFDTAGDRKAIPYLPQPAQPSFGLAGSVYNATIGFDPFTAKKLPGLGVSDKDDLKAKLAYFVQQITPNFPGVPGAYSTQKIMDAWRGAETSLGDRLPVWQAVAQSFGFKLRPADLDKMKRRKMLGLNRKLKSLSEVVWRASIDRKKQRISAKKFEEIKLAQREKARELVERLR